jgi:hypothetical protein
MAFTPIPPTLPDVDDATFVRAQPIDNPYSPFLVGDLKSFVTTEPGSDDQVERGFVFVTDLTRNIEGVTATVVRDTVYDEEGRWVEDTLDWYVQDTEGNVWLPRRGVLQLRVRREDRRVPRHRARRLVGVGRGRRAARADQAGRRKDRRQLLPGVLWRRRRGRRPDPRARRERLARDW